MGPSDNGRSTKIDLLAVFEAKAPNNVPERADLFDPIDSTPRADTPSRMTASSRGRASEDMTGTRKGQSRTVKSATRGTLQLRTTCESPWEKYEKFYDVELGGPMEVAIRKAAPVELVHVRAFVTQAAEKKLPLYRQLQHPNIVTALEAFTTDNGLYVVLEHMPLSLEQIVRSPAYPDERQLAAILGQVGFFDSFTTIY